MITGNAQLLNANPVILTVEEFASAGECEALIEAVHGRLERAQVTYDSQEPRESEGRSNSGYWLDQTAHPVAAALCMKIGVLLRLPFVHVEWLHVLHYAPGEEFRTHQDGYDMEGPDAERLEADGGQRLFTSIVYLNDVEEGGATHFPELGIRVGPKAGRLLVFANTLAGTNARCSLSRHAGEPVIQGEKWAGSTWWRERPAG
jgi:prolyl 4-hydroxylase